jgi:hypothetical protein
LVGQITEVGRNFYPSVTSVDVRAVYNREEIAFEVRWHDMRAETSGSNGPALEVPPWVEDNRSAEPAEGEGEDDFFGDLGGEPADDEDFFGDLGGEPVAADDDFFGDLESDASGAASDGFSDAVAIQLPAQQPTGNRKPYFIFGDPQSPVDLWFVDLARDVSETFRARGSSQIEPTDSEVVDTRASFEAGEWTVIYKRRRRSPSSISFGEGEYTPIAFSVWDGFNRERGNKRALTSWFYLYTEPSEVRSAVGPMVRVALIVLIAELLVLYLVRRRHARGDASARGSSAAAPDEAGPQPA